MSQKYPGGIISKTAPTPSGPYADSTAPGVWTLEQQAYWQKLGQWPTAGNVDPSAFIENLFSTYLYTGNSSTQTITNGIDLSTKGGLVWVKNRTGADNHILTDSARGTAFFLRSNLSNAQDTNSPSLISALNSNGFSLGVGYTDVNASANNYASWTFRKQPKFFDIVTWSGDSTSGRQIAHNLGSTPGMVIIKSLVVDNWCVWHRSLTAGNYIVLNSTAAQTTSGAVNRYGNGTTTVDPTSTYITVGSNGEVNQTGNNYVAYLFAHDAGGFGLTGTDNVISCGSFTASMGSLVNIGFEPQFVLIKRTDTSSVDDWLLFDNMRGLTMGDDSLLNPNTSGAENNSLGNNYINPQPTGFTQIGFGSGTYIYIAIRRGPMKVPTTGTSVFSPNTAVGGAAITTNFPVDTSISSDTGPSTGAIWGSRLQGTKQYLASYNTNAESSFGGSGWGFSNNTGLNQALYGGSTPSVFWNLVRAPGFHDVVCYTGTGADPQTVSHNLGVAPELMIFKARDVAAGWRVWGGNMAITSYLALSETSAVVTGSTFFGSTLPTATSFYVGSGLSVAARTIVAYLFATCPGVSKVGSYTGTGTTLQVNCGFTGGARWVMIKRTDSTGDWYVWDSARGIVAGNDPYLLLNSTAAEVTNTDYVDTYSAGFEISSTAPAAINANGGTFIFLAIA